MTINPELVLLADGFVRDLVQEVGRQAVEKVGRSVLRDRLAKAMQQACLDEYGALVEELTQ